MVEIEPRATVLIGLDFWRAVLMSCGLLVHASLHLEPTPLFTAIELISETFRMGAFFAIAGYLSAIGLAGRPEGWGGRRLLRLGVPAVVGVTAVSPIIYLLMVSRPADVPREPPLLFAWHHLWFLFGLIDYTVVALLFDRIDRRIGVIDRLASRHRLAAIRPLTILLAVALAIAIAFAATPVALRASLPPDYVRAFATAQFIAGYHAMFFLGFALGRSPELAMAMSAAWRISAAIVGATALAYGGWFVGAAMFLDAPAIDVGAAYLRFVGAALCPPAAFILILKSATAMTRIPDFGRRLADASYTIYIVHVPIAVAINTRLALVDWSPYAKYPIALCGTAIGSYAFHALLVRRSATLRLLLNGRWPGRAQRPDLFPQWTNRATTSR